MGSSSDALLGETLALAVPLHIERLLSLDDHSRQVLIREWTSPEAIELLTYDGMHILYPSYKRGDSARAFNAVAHALAVLALHTGGVTFGHAPYRTHWCPAHTWGQRAADLEWCPRGPRAGCPQICHASPTQGGDLDGRAVRNVIDSL